MHSSGRVGTFGTDCIGVRKYRYGMRRHPLRSSPCGEPTFVLKGLLMLLDYVMSNVVLLKSILIIRISSSRKNDSRMSINFALVCHEEFSLPHR